MKKMKPEQMVQGFIVDFLPVNEGGKLRFSPTPRPKGNSRNLSPEQVAEACGRIFKAFHGRMEEGDAKALWERVMGSEVTSEENTTQPEA